MRLAAMSGSSEFRSDKAPADDLRRERGVVSPPRLQSPIVECIETIEVTGLLPGARVWLSWDGAPDLGAARAPLTSSVVRSSRPSPIGSEPELRCAHRAIVNTQIAAL